MPNYKFGWIPDALDPRDYKFSASREALTAPPKSWDLSAQMPPVTDQGAIGACVFHAASNAHRYCQMRQGSKDFLPSRLAGYYWGREKEGTINQDSGSQIRTGVKVMADRGACPESMWPYDVRRFREKPPQNVETEALLHQAIVYERVQHHPDHIKAAIASGYPISFGFMVMPSFDSIGSDGVMPMPGRFERPKGGHAVLMGGYDAAIGRAFIQNSWSTRWGKSGWFYMPYDFLFSDDYCSDFWIVREVEITDAPLPPPGPAPSPGGWDGAEFDVGVGKIHIPAKPGDYASIGDLRFSEDG